jgi:HSP20 family molecular chaperone IbpA
MMMTAEEVGKVAVAEDCAEFRVTVELPGIEAPDLDVERLRVSLHPTDSGVALTLRIPKCFSECEVGFPETHLG